MDELTVKLFGCLLDSVEDKVLLFKTIELENKFMYNLFDETDITLYEHITVELLYRGWY